MSNLLTWVGRLAGSLGVLVCAVAVMVRLGGAWSLGGIQISTLLLLGMASMILACLAYCAEIAERPRS